MSTAIPFTDNYSDLSNNEGFQFEFRRERCGNGYRSEFRRDPAAAGQKLMRGLGNLLGGRLQDMTNAAENWLDRGTNSPAKDAALRAAVAEIAHEFHQCRGWGDWVCDDICWNTGVGQCARCSPVATEELSQLQAEARRYQTREKLYYETDMTGGAELSVKATPRCSSCGAQSSGGKFCTECGQPLAQVTPCAACGTDNPLSAKFCQECGGTLG